MSEWRGVLMPVAAMLAAQALLSMATVTLPVLAPAAAAEIGAPLAWIGLFVAIIYARNVRKSLGNVSKRHPSQSPPQKLLLRKQS